MASLCTASKVKYHKSSKSTKASLETKDAELTLTYIGINGIPVISEPLLTGKIGTDVKLQKNTSLSRLSHSVGPKKKFEGLIGTYS